MALSKRSASKGSADFVIARRHPLPYEPSVPASFYILRLKSGRLYPGATTNLAQRWLDHRNGKGGRTTQLDPPVGLVHQEQFTTFAEARRREAQLKRWSARKKEALVRSDQAGLHHLAVSHD